MSVKKTGSANGEKRLTQESSYSVQIISSFQEINEVSEEWEAFLAEHAERHTFWQDPKVIRHHLESTNREEPRIILLRKNRNIACIAPCVIKQTRFTFTFSIFKLPGPKLRILNILDSDFIFSKHADIKKCIEEIFLTLNENLFFDLIFLENLCSSSFLYVAFIEKKFEIAEFQLRSISPKTEKIWRHIFGDSYDKWLASLSRGTRGKIRRRIRNLHKRYPGLIELRKITQASQVPDYLTSLNELYPKTWQAKTFGPRKRNTEREIIFYQNIAENGWLRSYMLCVTQQPVAFLVGFQYNGTFHHAECGYDPSYSNDGVGSVLNYLTLQDLYDSNKPNQLDFGFGENEYKKILGNEVYDAFTAMISLPNIWRQFLNLQRLISLNENKMRSLIIKMKLEKIIRRILKRK